LVHKPFNLQRAANVNGVARIEDNLKLQGNTIMNPTCRRQTLTLSPRPLHLLALAALATLSAGNAMAQDSSYYYFGLGGGQTRGDVEERGLTNRVSTPPPGGYTNYSLATDRRDAGYKVFLGYQLNRYVGFELGYFNLGKQGTQVTTTPAGTMTAELRAQGANLDVVGTLPLTTNLSALGRVGTAYTRTRAQFSGTGAVVVTNPNPSDRRADMKVGVGLQYAFSPGFMMRAEGERYRISDATGGRSRANLYSVSLVFPFGRAPAPAPKVAYMPPPPPAPAPVVMAEAPSPAPARVMVAPVPAPAPAAPVKRRVTYSAESLFGFDKATIRPEGMTALDGFAAELAGASFDSITVEGHTDRIGSTAYNQKLSMERAEAVKAYLVSAGRVDAGKVNAVGMGEGTPATNAADCKGNTKTAALVTCLQPDRRVEIEVTGTR